MGHVNLDMDVLRTLVTAHELGSFNRAADRLGRSQSAISQQIRKIEAQVGEALFQKQGRGLANILLLPIYGKIKARIESELRFKKLYFDGLLAISRKESPQLIEARLVADIT